jgi:hypothetical protein
MGWSATVSCRRAGDYRDYLKILGFRSDSLEQSLEQRRDNLAIRQYNKIINDETHPSRKYIPDIYIYIYMYIYIYIYIYIYQYRIIHIKVVSVLLQDNPYTISMCYT